MLTFSHYVFKVSNMQSDKYALISDGIKEFAICILSKNFDVMKKASRVWKCLVKVRRKCLDFSL